MWVFIGLLMLLGLYVHHGGRKQSKTLDFLASRDLTVIRSTDPTHRFDRMGIQINTPENWAYLATSDDTFAESLFYANSSDQVIVRLRPASRAMTQLTGNKDSGSESHQGSELSLRWLDLTKRAEPDNAPIAVRERVELFSQLNPSAKSWLNIGLCQADGTTWIVQMSDLKRRDQTPACLSKLLGSIKQVD